MALKNELTLWTNLNSTPYLSLFFTTNFTTLIDLVGYDPSFSVNKNLIKSNMLVYKLYNYFNDTYTNLFFSKIKSISGLLLSASWLEREVKEMFHTHFRTLKDTRNILLDYNLTTPILLKRTPLEFFNDVKRAKSTILDFSQTIEL